MQIEQLLERYFNADTTVSEERQLREYFATGDIPQHLLKYKAMFSTLAGQEQQLLGSDAEQHTAAAQEQKSQPHAPRLIRLYTAIRPLLRATACVAVIITAAMVAEQGMREDTPATVAVPANSQQVGISVSEWNGMTIVETTPADTIASSGEITQ